MALTEVRCPSCRRVTPWQGNPTRPFCSERCRTADLGNWASERYRVPGTTLESEDELPGEPDPTRH